MNHGVGIWIDHERAVIVSASADAVTTRTLTSDVAGHPRWGGQQDGGGEKRYEERHNQRLGQFYDEVISLLGKPEAIVIFGPGEAKLELKERLGRSKALPKPTVDVGATDRLTEPQIMTKVKEHFGLDG